MYTCSLHGPQEPTVVCQHIAVGLDDGHSCGFFFEPEPGIERPDAWCAACEKRRKRAEGWTESALADAGMKTICGACYDQARRHNGPWTPSLVMDPQKLLADCVQAVGAPPRRFAPWDRWGYLRPRKPTWAYGDDDIRPYFNRYAPALRRGRVGWGVLVRADSELRQRGSQGLAGEVVFVRDPAASVDLIALQQVARRISEIRGTPASQDELGQLDRVYGLVVPDRLSPSMPCAMSTVVFDRRHLPNGVLSRDVVPLLVTTDSPRVAIVLPSRYWPAALRRYWVAE